MRNYFTFDGIDSRSFGVYISGQGTFKAPARSYDAMEIPGRNGALLGIDSRLGNVELTYPAFIYSNFAENIAAFRAFLLSHKGYFKLKDSYHPSEFRLAYYPGPFDPDVTSANNAGSFDITFICKPQRYLESGEEVIELTPGQSETHTYTGNPASFVALDGDQITSLQIPLRFSQNLHGYDHPWPGGGGVNKLPITEWFQAGYTVTANGVTMTVNSDGSITLSGTASAQADFYLSRTTSGVTQNPFYVDAGTYTISMKGTQTIPGVKLVMSGSGKNGYPYSEASSNGAAKTGAVTDATQPFNYLLLRITGGTVSDGTYYIQFESGSTATEWTPYSNICPISGLTGLTVYVGPTHDSDDATEYAVTFPEVLAGSIDPVTGEIKSRPVYNSYNGETIIGPWASSLDEYAPGATPTIGAQVVDLGGAETTSQITPIIISVLNGINNVWSSNSETVSVDVSTPVPAELNNPTLFDALPFLRVYGTGILGIGSHTITITAADVYTDIDCEMMDCFKGSANKNQYVQFSGNDFPTLEPGVNGFSFSGITKVEVKPRWWSV